MRSAATNGFVLITAAMLAATGAGGVGGSDGPAGGPGAQKTGSATPAAPATADAKEKPEFPPFAKVSEGFKQVVSRADGGTSLYRIWVKEKEHQILAELNTGFEGQKIFIATSIAGGERRTGWQWQELYCYWLRHHKTLVLMEPQLRRRAGDGPQDAELALAVKRTYNDRVVTSVPIVATGPGRGPVIDLDALLIGQAKVFTDMKGNAALAQIGHIKAFEQNIDVRGPARE